LWETQNRKEFSNEIKSDYQKTKKSKYRVKSVWALLLNSQEDYLLVQRGNTFDSVWIYMWIYDLEVNDFLDWSAKSSIKIPSEHLLKTKSFYWYSI